jgi:hypothetical protein
LHGPSTYRHENSESIADLVRFESCLSFCVLETIIVCVHICIKWNETYLLECIFVIG